jgi:hypothetical protein
LILLDGLARALDKVTHGWVELKLGSEFVEEGRLHEKAQRLAGRELAVRTAGGAYLATQGLKRG